MTALPLLSSCESELYFYTFIEEAQTKLRVGCGVTTVLTSAEPLVPRVWVEVGWASGIVRFVFHSGVFFIQLWGYFYYTVEQNEHVLPAARGGRGGGLFTTWKLRASQAAALGPR